MHVQQEIEICLASQYEESTMEILSLVPRETFALRVQLKKKKRKPKPKVFIIAKFLSVWMMFYWRSVNYLEEKQTSRSS